MLSDEVVQWLLEEENPSVRFYTLTSLQGKSLNDKLVKEAKKAIMEYGVVSEILEKQNDDGSWGIPERFYRDKYTGTVWTLLILAEMGADGDNHQIKKACEFILKHSQNPESGGFSYDQSSKTGNGIFSGVVPCLTGNMVYSLIKLGYLKDERVQDAINWITSYQRIDDGSEIRPSGKVYERYEMCWGRHTCHMGVAKAMKALSAISIEKRSETINAKLDELVEYFLKHHIYKKSHNLDEIARPGWLRLGFPLMYQTDVLEILSLLTDLKIKDSRMEDAIEIIKSRQMKDGKWKLQNSFNGRTIVDIEKKSMPSKWITLKALKILKENN